MDSWILSDDVLVAGIVSGDVVAVIWIAYAVIYYNLIFYEEICCEEEEEIYGNDVLAILSVSCARDLLVDPQWQFFRKMLLHLIVVAVADYY